MLRTGTAVVLTEPTEPLAEAVATAVGLLEVLSDPFDAVLEPAGLVAVVPLLEFADVAEAFVFESVF